MYGTLSRRSEYETSNEKSPGPAGSWAEWKVVLQRRNRTAPDRLGQGICVSLAVAMLAYCGLTANGRARFAKAATPHSSEIDWCESNYAVSPHVAEFWNTLSSLPMLWVAHRVHCDASGKFDAIRPTCWQVPALFTMIALGSAYFHTSLSLLGQVLDELPITMVNIYGILCVRARPAVAQIFGKRLTNVVRSGYFAIAFMLGFPLVGILWPTISHVTVVLTIPATLCTCISAFRGCGHGAKATLRPTYR